MSHDSSPVIAVPVRFYDTVLNGFFCLLVAGRVHLVDTAAHCFKGKIRCTAIGRAHRSDVANLTILIEAGSIQKFRSPPRSSITESAGEAQHHSDSYNRPHTVPFSSDPLPVMQSLCRAALRPIYGVFREGGA